jgi:hypothetical protein
MAVKGFKPSAAADPPVDPTIPSARIPSPSDRAHDDVDR